jgi:hypothetical protein
LEIARIYSPDAGLMEFDISKPWRVIMARASKSKVNVTRNKKTKSAGNRKISQIMTFRDDKSGKVFHIDLQTKAPSGKIVAASIDGKVNSVTIAH